MARARSPSTRSASAWTSTAARGGCATGRRAAPEVTRLAHGDAAEDEGLEGEETGVGGHVDLQAALEPAAVEEDRLLRQPVERARRRRASRRVSIVGGAAGGAVDALGGLRGGDERGAGAGREAPVDAVAAGDAARGVEEHRLGNRAMGSRQDAPWRSPAGRAGRGGCLRHRARPRLRRGRGRAAGSGGRRGRRAWRELRRVDAAGATSERPADGRGGRVAQSLGSTGAELGGKETRTFYQLIKNPRYASLDRRKGEVHGTQSADARDRRRAARAAAAGGQFRGHRTALHPARGAGGGGPLLLLLRRALHHGLPDLDRHSALHPRDPGRQAGCGGADHPRAEHPRRHVRAGLPDRDALRGGLRARGGGRQAGGDRPAAALRHRHADGARRPPVRRGRRRPASGWRWSARGRRAWPARTGWRCSGTG